MPGAEPDDVLRAVFDALPQAILIFDSNTQIVFANAKATSVFLPGEAQLNSSLAALRSAFLLMDASAESPARPDALPVSRALRGETVDEEEICLRRPGSGARIWIECGARPIRDSSGRIAGAVLAFRNISKRKERELELAAADQLRDFVYNENLAGIIHSTIDGRIIECNDAILRMFGYDSKRELFAVRATQLYFDPSERDRLIRLVRGPGRLSEFEVCFRRRDGSRCWALLNVRLLDPPAGQVGGTIVSTAIDITERKRSEETLRKSEQRFAAFMRHLPGVAFIKDLSGTYVYYNEASWAQFQMRPEDIVGRTDGQIWPSEDAARYRENDESVVATKRPFEFVEPVTHADGVHSWLIYKFPIIEADRVILVGGVGIDITERKSLEEQLTQVRKMEALGRLAGGVAHDFNNLLTVISGYGQLALESVGTAAPAQMSVYMQEVLNSSRRAAGLTGQLLAFSRRQAVQPAVLDVRVLLRDMELLLQRVIGEHVQLTVECGREPCLIYADEHQMEQVVMNLAVNARDAMPLGGLLDLRCRLMGGPSAEVLIEIGDSGIGMDEKTRAQIFDPFFTSKEVGKGTGLGLSIVYGAVSQAQGRIEVESAPGAGTTFRMYFPATAPADRAPEDLGVRVSSTPTGSETVLLVEDEAGVRALAETILTRLGYRVMVADCGETALTVWEECSGRVDILLTDVIMPRISGGDLAHRLRAKNPRLKVLFMSGYTDDMIASHGSLAGETQLIQKPFTAERLGRILRDVLDV